MKRRIWMIAMAAMLAVGMWAAPALPRPMQVVQPDGTLLTVELQGDEYDHWMTTTDGTLVVSKGGAYYVAAIDDHGCLEATKLLAHEPQFRSSEEQQAVNRQVARRHLWNAPSRRAATISTTGGYLPHQGSPRVLVILAEYQDLKFIVNDPVKAFNQYLNGDVQEPLGNQNELNRQSVRKYFETVSHGQFTPQFDIVGPVTLPQEMAYYGQGSNGSERMGELCKDATELAKDSVDFHLYDNDGDGRAELVFIIFSGIGQNQGGPEDNMWAKMSVQNRKLTDDLTVTRCGCSSELFYPAYPTYINGTGVFIHEFSHALGLPDLYATNTAGRKVNNQGMEYWDVMDGGLYTYNGFAPTAYTAWEQEAMGWIEIEPLTESAQGLSLLPLIEDDGKAYKLCNKENDREFIVLENIQKRGVNYKAYGHGLLVYHVAYPNSIVNMADSPNNNAGKPAVAIVPADGLMISTYQRDNYNSSYGGSYTSEEYRKSFEGDPFPGANEVSQLTSDMNLPNYVFYGSEDNERITMQLQNIREDEQTGAVLFDVVKEDPDGIRGVYDEPTSGLRSLTPKQNEVFDLQGRRIDSSKMSKGLYIVNGKKVRSER